MNKEILKKIIFTKKTALFFVLAVFFVALDSFLKTLCLRGLLDQPFPLIGNVLSLHYAKNYGIAFSIPLGGPILTAVIGVIILILASYWVKLLIQNSKLKTQNSSFIPLIILILGAILNFIDRLKFGYVIDYFDLKWFTIFNLADCLIIISIFILLIKNLMIKNKKAPF